MPLYTFYPYTETGASETFLASDLPDDGAAAMRALEMLSEHPDATSVAVWCGERRALTRHRMDAEHARLPGRSPSWPKRSGA